jgi:hypothetical protein
MRKLSLCVATVTVAAIAATVQASKPLPPKLIYNDQLPPDAKVLAPLAAGVRFQITINDASGTYSAYHDDLERIAEAAAAAWGGCLDSSASIELRIGFDTSSEDYIMRAGPIMVQTGEEFEGFDVWQAGTIWELNGHTDPNGASPDGDIIVNSRFLNSLFWDYPSAPGPSDLDAYDTLLHELGHVFGFIHMEEFYTGEGPWASSYDINTTPSGNGHFFAGPAAVAAYGGPVPLADIIFDGDRSHVAIENGPGSLMYPYADLGARHEVTAIELGVVADSGMPLLATCASPTDDPGDDQPLADQDEDGVADSADNCPSTANATQADGDHDEAGDACDGCPADFRKTAPGICGCGTADIDTDDDGALNCDEECPFDADKTEPGACGCGRTDLDRDEDGTADCTDGCPLDPEKTSAGLAGCGNPEPTVSTNGPSDNTNANSDYLTVDPSTTGGSGCGAGAVGALSFLSLGFLSLRERRRQV